MPKGWTPDKIKENKEKVARTYSGVDPNRTWAEQQREAWDATARANNKEKEEEKEKKATTITTSTITPPIPPTPKKKKNEENGKFALLVGFITATVLTLIVGVVTLNWYILVPGFILLIVWWIVIAVGSASNSGRGGGHYDSRRPDYLYGASARRGRSLRMWRAHRAGGGRG